MAKREGLDYSVDSSSIIFHYWTNIRRVEQRDSSKAFFSTGWWWQKVVLLLSEWKKVVSVESRNGN